MWYDTERRSCELFRHFVLLEADARSLLAGIDAKIRMWLICAQIGPGKVSVIQWFYWKISKFKHELCGYFLLIKTLPEKSHDVNTRAAKPGNPLSTRALFLDSIPRESFSKINIISIMWFRLGNARLLKWKLQNDVRAVDAFSAKPFSGIQQP